MANPFVKGWRYLMALFGAKIDEYADPKIQIQQAIDEAKVQHQGLVRQAAAVIGNQRQLEMRLSRQMSEMEKWQGMARQGLVLADKARAEGDEQKGQEYERAAQSAATQLVSAEQAVEDLKTLHDQALNAAQQARKAVENNKMLLEEKLAERSKLLSQLEQAKMQETVASSLESMSALAAPGNTPSLDEIRDKIEGRYASAMGRAELASNSVEGRMLEVQRTTLDMAGASRLEQIRASMAGQQLTGASERPAVEAGEEADATGARDATVSRLDEIRASLANEGATKDAAKSQGDTAAAGCRVAQVLDERTRHRRRLRRLRGSVRRWTVTAGGLAATTTVLVPYQGLGPWDAVWAGLTGASVVFAWWRWSDLRELAAQPEPEPLDPAQAGERWLTVLSHFPGGLPLAESIRRQRVRNGLRGSEAVEAWERLDRSARTMRELTSRLGGSDPEAVREASRVERELRELADRIVGLERAVKAAPPPAQAPLRELRGDHLGHLRTGVAAYEEFVVAAAGFAAESARTGDHAPTVVGLSEATDRLRGVTAGLSELRRLYGDLRVTG